MRVYRILPVALAMAAGTALSAAQTAPRPGPPTESGRKIYEREKCTTCHSIARRGNTRFPLDGVAGRLTMDELRRWITNTAEMEKALPRLPAVRMSVNRYKLSAGELDALVAYLATLK